MVIMGTSIFHSLSDKDTISLTHSAQDLNDLNTFQVKERYESLRTKLGIQQPDQPLYNWIGEGIAGQCLCENRTAEGWIEGKIRIGMGVSYTTAEVLDRSTADIYLPNHRDLLRPIDTERLFLVKQYSFRASELLAHLRSRLQLTEPVYTKYHWLDRGIECEVLRTTGEISGWQSGLVRIQLEFLPKVPTMEQASDPIDDSISPLDSLRA
jgi:KGK domain